MELSGKMATWLELAVAPDWHRRRSTIKLHPVAGREGRCFVLSMDNRWLCVASGQLTVFRGEEAARRFLQLVHLQAVESDEPPPGQVVCDGTHYCLHADCPKGLSRCKGCHRERNVRH